MTRLGREHGRCWRESFEIDGETFTVEARHHVRRRMPRGHELARQAMSGRPHSMVEETDHEWAVVGGDRLLGTLRQLPSGSFHDGRRDYRGEGILAAAADMVRALRPRVASERPASRGP